MSVDNIFVVESKACPPLDEIKKLPNKVLLWCGKLHSFSFSSRSCLSAGYCFIVKHLCCLLNQQSCYGLGLLSSNIVLLYIVCRNT